MFLPNALVMQNNLLDPLVASPHMLNNSQGSISCAYQGLGARKLGPCLIVLWGASGCLAFLKNLRDIVKRVSKACELHAFDTVLCIHPASRGVAAHTAGLFRSVRGAKGGFPPWGLPKLRILTSPPWGLPKLGNFPPVGASQAREFSLFPPWGLPKLGNFHFSPRGGFPS